MVDPTDRNINTSVIPQVMSVLVFPKVSARSETVRETVKKSKASQDHAKKATRKNSHCLVLKRVSSLKGFSAFAMGGLRVEMRVARYLMGDMCWWDMSSPSPAWVRAGRAFSRWTSTWAMVRVDGR